MGTVLLDDVKFDSSIYPRNKWKTSTITTYVDALKGGAQFPPIILERGTDRLLDGVHRWKAHLRYREAYQERAAQLSFDEAHLEDWAEPRDDIEVEWREIPEGIPAKLYAAQFSREHGDRITGSECKAIAREVYKANPDFTIEVLRQHLKVSKSRAHNYVSDILARRKEEKKMTAFRLHLLGWTQAEIGDVVGVSQQAIAGKLQLFPELEKVVKNLLAEGHPHTKVAERYNVPLILVWAIDLEGRTDQQRFGKLGIKIQPYDVWNFSSCHSLFGAKWPGRIPGQIVAHTLFFYTEPGAKVIDPMAGSGTTVDVCLAMGRECYAYDADTKLERPDIIHADLKEGWPDRIKKADLIFWDPPYFDKKDGGYSEDSISRFDRAEYLAFFQERLTEAHGLVKKGTRLAFLMSDWDDATGQSEGVFLWDYADILRESGWALVRHNQVPLSTQQVHPDIVNKFRKQRRQARLERYLLVGVA